MPITEEQRAERRKFLGSSDTPPILGLSEYSSPWDIQASKIYETRDNPSPAAWIGTHCEGAILNMAAEKLGVVLARDVRVVADNGIMAANCDGMTPNGEPVEAKMRGSDDEWGAESDDAMDSCPLPELVQLMHQMVCCKDAPRGYLAVLLASRFGFAFKLYTYERNDEMLGRLERKLLAWWQRHIVEGVEADRRCATYEAAWNVERKPGVAKSVDVDTVREYVALREARLAAEKAEKQAKTDLLTQLGDASVGIVKGWDVRMSTGKRRVLTVKEEAVV